ncbi:putative N-acetyltransferase Aca1p [[Candida] jaroonii]|uniref:N-acetyltransferase Aca1p n=1 Tax=[Candida] jaroonii TaxID=467808 RepID=A0ACA9Y9U9_9ASCO|nr:putative N-acetyltransferase Aca1p [[Candida] jaroonii]
MVSDFQLAKDLPFADGKFPIVITKFQNYELKGKKVTLIPVHKADQIPLSLVKTLHKQFNHVIEEGKTYPHHEPFPLQKFIDYWFIHFVAILVEGTYTSYESLKGSENWDDLFLGNFYIKSNYIGRCSHVCNAGFITNYNKRGLGIGKALGRKYLELAPQLGFTYSVFNLVFETNVASLKIWDGLGFERIGYVKNVAVLKGENKLVGAVMYGKDLQNQPLLPSHVDHVPNDSYFK